MFCTSCLLYRHQNSGDTRIADGRVIFPNRSSVQIFVLFFLARPLWFLYKMLCLCGLVGVFSGAEDDAAEAYEGVVFRLHCCSYFLYKNWRYQFARLYCVSIMSRTRSRRPFQASITPPQFAVSRLRCLPLRRHVEAAGGGFSFGAFISLDHAKEGSTEGVSVHIEFTRSMIERTHGSNEPVHRSAVNGLILLNAGLCHDASHRHQHVEFPSQPTNDRRTFSLNSIKGIWTQCQTLQPSMMFLFSNLWLLTATALPPQTEKI